MDKTIIAWTERTWNPWRGCTKVSPGCAHCYMFTQQTRYGEDPSLVQRTKTTWNDPLKWEREAAAADRIDRVFTCSWSDWFHEAADSWRDDAWAVIRKCPHLDFQILTKRDDRIADNLPADWGDGYANVWLGVSIENGRYVQRADRLRGIPAAVRFISAEPLLAPLPSLDLTGIDWLIVGGESGPGFRPMDLAWVRELRAKARASGAAFFFKQSAAPRSETGITLDGEIVREYPRSRADASTRSTLTIVAQPVAAHELADLANAINAAHEAAELQAFSALEHARTAGALLQQAKGQLPHGAWLRWLTEHCACSPRTAQAYMRIADRWSVLEEANTQRVAPLPVREAMRLLSAGPTRSKKDPEPFHWIEAVGNLRELVERTVSDWPESTRALVPSALRGLATILEREWSSETHDGSVAYDEEDPAGDGAGASVEHPHACGPLNVG